MRRERGLRLQCGIEDSIYNSIYGAFQPYTSWNSSSNSSSEYGGVYNLEFSPDGLVLFMNNYII